MRPSSLIAFPLHRRGTLRDTVAGFPDRASTPSAAVSRRERAVTVAFVEIRGWREVPSRMGSGPADAMFGRALRSVVEAIRSLGAVEVTIGGEDRRPVVVATFCGPDHPVRAIRAACLARDALAAGNEDPPTAHRFRACVGIDTGVVVDAVLGPGGCLAYRSAGTVRLFANRLQEFAGPDQIFLSDAVAATLRSGGVPLRSIGAVRTHAGGSAREAFCLAGEASPGPSSVLPTAGRGPVSAAG